MLNIRISDYRKITFIAALEKSMKPLVFLSVICGLITSSSLYSLTGQEIEICKGLHSSAQQLDLVQKLVKSANSTFSSEKLSEMINYDPYGAGSLFHAAAARGNINLLQYLFHLNQRSLIEVDFNQPSQLYQDTPLMVAAFHRNDEISKFLIKDVRIDFCQDTFQGSLPILYLNLRLSATCAQILEETQRSSGYGFVNLRDVFR